MDALALTLFVLAPMVGSAFIMALPEKQVSWIRRVALLCTFLMLLVSIYVYFSYDPHGPLWQFEVHRDWISNLRIGYHLGVDGISLPLVLLTGILSFGSVLASFAIRERVKEYFVLLLLVCAGIAGSFVTLDLFFFILFYELASIPIYFLIGMWGSDGQHASRNWVTKREFSALKLILYLQLGGALILIGFFAFYLFSKQAGLTHPTFDFVELSQGNFGRIPHFAQIIFPLLFVAFGFEAGLFPFHTWLPDGHSAAPTAVSMLLAGALLKMGGYGMIRFASQLLPDGARDWLWVFGIVAVVNILYGAWCALKQTDLKYIIAYSSVSHMGIVFLGLASRTLVGWTGALFQMFSHGIITALLFALAGLIYEKTHTRNVSRYGGLAVKMPFLAASFVVAGLGSLGLPSMSGFVAEFLTFMGTYPSMKILAILAVFGLILSALYILLNVKKIFFGPLNPQYAGESYANAWWEKLHVSGLIFVAVLFGIVPGLITTLAKHALGLVVQTLAGMR